MLSQLQAFYTVFEKSDAKIQITITTAYLIRIKYPLSGFNYYHLSDVNVANFNKIHRTVSEQQLEDVNGHPFIKYGAIMCLDSTHVLLNDCCFQHASLQMSLLTY